MSPRPLAPVDTRRTLPCQASLRGVRATLKRLEAINALVIVASERGVADDAAVAAGSAGGSAAPPPDMSAGASGIRTIRFLLWNPRHRLPFTHTQCGNTSDSFRVFCRMHAPTDRASPTFPTFSCAGASSTARPTARWIRTRRCCPKQMRRLTSIARRGVETAVWHTANVAARGNLLPDNC